MDKDFVYNNSIILIGPVGVGKSTISDALVNVLGMPQISMDDMRKIYYPRYGFNKEQSDKLLKQDLKLWLMYQKQFEIKMVEEVLGKLTEPAVIDFGASQAHYFDNANKNKVAELLKPFNHVVSLEYPSVALEYAETKPLNKNLFLKTDQFEKLAKYSFVCDIYSEQVGGGIKLDNNGNAVLNSAKINRLAYAMIDRYRFMQYANSVKEKNM